MMAKTKQDLHKKKKTLTSRIRFKQKRLQEPPPTQLQHDKDKGLTPSSIAGTANSSLNNSPIKTVGESGSPVKQRDNMSAFKPKSKTQNAMDGGRKNVYSMRG